MLMPGKIMSRLVLFLSVRRDEVMKHRSPLRKNKRFWIGMGLTLLEGFLSSGNFVLIYVVIDGLYSGRLEFTQNPDVNRNFSHSLFT